jgi:APA family basic amino acid/polyamine antiporter
MASSALAREVRLPGAVALVVGQVIAVGIFLTPGSIIRSVTSPFWMLLVWIAIGGMAICGALCYGALAARFPQTGGGYVYLRQTYGPRLAFLYGWKCFLIMDPGITAALATGFAAYAAYLLPLGPVGMRLAAVAAIGLFAVVHIIGVRAGTRLLTTLSVLKIVLIVVLIGAALDSRSGGWDHFVPFVARRPGAPPMAGALAGALVAAFFTFGGWWEVTKIAGEVQDPARTLPRALAIALGIVTLLYFAVTAAFVYAIPIERVSAGQAFVTQIGEAVFGPGGGVAVAIMVVVSVVSSLGTMMMFAPRLYYAMARDGLFPPQAAAVHPRFRTPARAIAIQAGLSATLVLIGTFDTIVAFFVFITVAFIALTVASVFVLRRRTPDLHVPGYPFTPVAFLAMVVVLMVLIAAHNPLQAALGTIIVAAGLPVYRLVQARSAGPSLLEKLT